MSRRAVAATCLLLGGAVGVASCSSSPGAAKGTKSVTPGSTVPFKLSRNARSAVATTGCTQQSGAWVLTGTVKNSSSSGASYQIVVDFVTNPGGTVLATSVVNVPDVGAGKTSDWTATGAHGANHVACIVRQAQKS